MGQKSFRCEICGLHYIDRNSAQKCYAWCSTHKSCNLEITRYSIERQGRNHNHNQ